MSMDRNIEDIIREIREANEGFGIYDPDRDPPEWKMQAAEDLSSAVLQLEVWLDEHGPEALKDPYRSPGPPVGYGPYLDADGNVVPPPPPVRRSWRSRLWRSWVHLRRAATSRT